MVQILRVKLGHLFPDNISSPQTLVEAEIPIIATCLFLILEHNRSMSLGVALYRPFLFGLLCHLPPLFFCFLTSRCLFGFRFPYFINLCSAFEKEQMCPSINLWQHVCSCSICYFLQSWVGEASFQEKNLLEVSFL